MKCDTLCAQTYPVGEMSVTMTWSNGAALEEMNKTIDQSLSVDDVAALQSIGAWGGSSNTTVILGFAEDAVGRNATFYVFSSFHDVGRTSNLT